MHKYLKNTSGFSLTELMVVTGLSTIVVLVGARLLQDSFTTVKQVEIRTNIYQYYNTIVKNLYNNRAWTNTFNHPSNGDLYTCLRQTNPKSESDFDRCINFDDTAAGTRDDINLGFLLHLRDSSNQTLVDFNQAGQGFSKDGVTCNSFNAGAPDESCPFRVRVFWRLRCADRLSQGGTTCRHPSVELSVVTENSSAPDRLGKLRVSSFQDTIIKDAQKMQDPITILCDSVGATYDENRGRCLQDFPNDTCPAGFYVTGIRADGTLICVDPTPTCYFSLVPETADEGDGTKNLQVDLSRTTSNTVTINYQVTGGTATRTGADPDYTLADGVIVISPLALFQNIPVVINDDALSEGSETVEVTLTSATNCNIDNPSVNTLTINDNDSSPQFFFTSPNSTFNDTSTQTVNITVGLAPQASTATSVSYSITGGSAVNGTDYNLGAGTLNFPALAASRNISFQILGDAVSEGTETATITLNSPVGATLQPGGESHTVTLTDGLPSVQFATIGNPVDETAGIYGATITLSPSSASPVSVNCTLNSASSSANAGTDFAFSNQVITFAPGELSKPCNIAIINDGAPDPDETVVLELNTPSGAIVGSPSSHNIQITESGGGGSICGIDPLGPDEACCTYDAGGGLASFPLGFAPYNTNTHCCGTTGVFPAGSCGIPICTLCPNGTGDTRVFNSIEPGNGPCQSALVALGPGNHFCRQCQQSGGASVWELWRDTGTPQACL